MLALSKFCSFMGWYLTVTSIVTDLDMLKMDVICDKN